MATRGRATNPRRSSPAKKKTPARRRTTTRTTMARARRSSRKRNPKGDNLIGAALAAAGGAGGALLGDAIADKAATKAREDGTEPGYLAKEPGIVPGLIGAGLALFGDKVAKTAKARMAVQATAHGMIGFAAGELARSVREKNAEKKAGATMPAPGTVQVQAYTAGPPLPTMEQIRAARAARLAAGSPLALGVQGASAGAVRYLDHAINV